jgi:hypothetical protein
VKREAEEEWGASRGGAVISGETAMARVRARSCPSNLSLNVNSISRLRER